MNYVLDLLPHIFLYGLVVFVVVYGVYRLLRYSALGG